MTEEQHRIKGLPEDFCVRMREQLGGEADRFFACYEEESRSGIRINTRKAEPDELAGSLFMRTGAKEICLQKQPAAGCLQRVPWTENGFYTGPGEMWSENPCYYAGLYYIQEPSAMLPASRLPVEPGDCVLDLCAAPGGKATELASRLKGDGLLVANDASASRAKALLKNLTVWGVPEICVTAETPERLLSAFGCFFDKILVDAPCSGEGMFRRDRKLCAAWEKRGPKDYAPLQKEILSCAVRMLKPGGMLLYSTCTFSREENEDVVADALTRFPGLELLQPRTEEGFSPGLAPLEKCIRVYPHRVKGEGHFLALMRKRRQPDAPETSGPDRPGSGGLKGIGELHREGGNVSAAENAVPAFSGMQKKNYAENQAVPVAVSAFLSLCRLPEVKEFRYVQLQEQCLLVPPYRLPEKIRYLRTGLLLGTLKNGRFEPSQALAMCLNAADFETVLDLPFGDARVLRYLRGETVELMEEERVSLEAALSQAARRLEKEYPARSSGRFRSGAASCGRRAKKEYAGELFLPSGWVLVCVGGYALGWAKYAGGALRNKYYPGWRLQ